MMTAASRTRESIAAALCGVWRPTVGPPRFMEDELARIVPLLIQSGAGALVWRRVRETNLAESPTGLELQQTYRLHRLQSSLHLRRIKRVVSLLRENNIEPVLLKGWSIARLYAEPGLRHYFDVDLCVAHRDYAAAQQAISALGDEISY